MGFKVHMQVYSEALNPESYFSRECDEKATIHKARFEFVSL